MVKYPTTNPDGTTNPNRALVRVPQGAERAAALYVAYWNQPQRAHAHLTRTGRHMVLRWDTMGAFYRAVAYCADAMQFGPHHDAAVAFEVAMMDAFGADMLNQWDGTDWF